MQLRELNLKDESRSRSIPTLLYLPDNKIQNHKIVIFSNGYQEQATLADPKTILGYKKWQYLAEYFTSKGYIFISIQHDMLGDNDGIETLDPKDNQAEARKHLWIRGEKNILFVISEIRKQYHDLNFNNFIIAGHSNGADIARFFSNNRPENISHVISFDGRRCPIAPYTKQRILMFEALDTSTDIDVIPDEGTTTFPKRKDLEWVIIKPKDAMHISYRDDQITDSLKKYVLKSLNFFLDE